MAKVMKMKPTRMSSGSSTAPIRLHQDYTMFMRNPDPYIKVAMNSKDMFEWHYLLYGPPNTPYHNGIYHGKLRFPVEYPFRPPSFYMITPNGRFETNTKICLSISDYHPNSWNPTWNMSTILTALLSFMTETRMTTGAIHSTDGYKRMMARKSLAWNLNNPQFVELFPEVAKEIREKLDKEELEMQQEKSNAKEARVQHGGDLPETGNAIDDDKPNDGGGYAFLFDNFAFLAVVIAILGMGLYLSM